ncbi:LuxR C-terminal-related transcriptional regulator [Nocardia tengchongensis]|uniref:LuxR C-terminal-related transcriptional regulator n=1 Tax=Nocardia tengchongensis TaxID=2055889 RepID=UPI0036CE26B6
MPSNSGWIRDSRHTASSRLRSVRRCDGGGSDAVRLAADLLDGIRRAATGERPFSPDVLHRLVESAVAAHSDAEDEISGHPDLYALTRREADVLALLTEGLSNAEIAARLVLGVTTVKPTSPT